MLSPMPPGALGLALLPLSAMPGIMLPPIAPGLPGPPLPPPPPALLLLSLLLGRSGAPAPEKVSEDENIFLRFWLFFKFSVRSVSTSLNVFVVS